MSRWTASSYGCGGHRGTDRRRRGHHQGAPRVHGNLGAARGRKGNDRLTILTGLHALTSTEGNLTISDNSALTGLAGLEALTSIGSCLSICENDALVDVSGLSAFTTVGDDVEVKDNVSLPRAEAIALVSGIDSIGGTVTVSGNAP